MISTILILLSPILAVLGLFVLAFVYASVIKFLLVTMSQVERLWDGDMFLGLASYVPHDERWYRGADGEWYDRQEELAAALRGKDYVK